MQEFNIKPMMCRIVGYASRTIVQAAAQIQSGNYLLQCARRGQRDNFLAVLAAAPDVDAIEKIGSINKIKLSKRMMTK